MRALQEHPSSCTPPPPKMPALTHAPSRKKIEKAILNKLKDIHAIKERLYTLRYDTTQPHEDTVRDVEVRTRHKKWHQRAQLDCVATVLIVLPPLGGCVDLSIYSSAEPHP